MESPSPHKLLREARDGDQAAFGRLLESVRPYIRVLARGTHRGLLTNRVDDSDLVQDALVEVTRSFQHFQGSGVPEFLAWLKAVVTHTVHNSVRQVVGTQKRNLAPTALRLDPSLLPGSEASPESVATLREESLRLASALEQLPTDMQQVLLLRLVDDLPHATIAVQLGRTEQAVRMLFVRSIRRLRELMRA